MKATREEATKRTANTMVALNKNFSAPRRVWKLALQFSPPPKAPPKEALACCNKTAAVKRTARIICIYGRIAVTDIDPATIA